MSMAAVLLYYKRGLITCSSSLISTYTAENISQAFTLEVPIGTAVEQLHMSYSIDVTITLFLAFFVPYNGGKPRYIATIMILALPSMMLGLLRETSHGSYMIYLVNLVNILGGFFVFKGESFKIIKMKSHTYWYHETKIYTEFYFKNKDEWHKTTAMVLIIVSFVVMITVLPSWNLLYWMTTIFF